MEEVRNMTNTNRDKGNIAKGVLVGAAVIAGGAAAMALKDKNTRKKVGQSLKNMGKKGIALTKKAEKWARDHPLQNDVVERFLEKNPERKAPHASASR